MTYYSYPGIPIKATEIVADILQLPLENIKSKSRKTEIVKARKIIMLTKHLSGNRIGQIAKEFELEHGTIIYCLRTIKEDLQTNEHTRLIVAKVIARLNLSSEYNTYLQRIKKEFWL